ncbi:hypothetical protein BCY90_17415 [Agrobacterium deltaense]|uniref:hypothetical protein n=1 Tax=Agrobacterium TaxID=357 RepID=UPI0007459762|nr:MULTISPECIES: hypothetical protein [Agrobacterium]KVK43573.1 hypothetical protein L901_26395 [Agrobacterium sp. D14]RKF41583.1 hypothetical protein BCY90_17415 [Agrobacterium deltaense]
MQAEVRSAIICDDIRKEITGKDILIGVYSGAITVPSYPLTFPTAFWFEIEPKILGSLDFAFKITSPTGNPPIELGGTMQIVALEPTIFAISGIPLHAEHDGDIVLSFRSGENEWIEIKRKKIIRVSPGQTN